MEDRFKPEYRSSQRMSKKQQKEQLYEAYNLLHSLAQVRHHHRLGALW
jgi:tRNA 2-selenouridine synthase SelU